MMDMIDDLTLMRLVIEGDIALYENEGKASDPASYDMLAGALYILRNHVNACLNTYRETVGKA